MKKKLCLQDVSGISEIDLSERLRAITGWKNGKTEEREQWFDLDGEEVVLRCRETELLPVAKSNELRLFAREALSSLLPSCSPCVS